MDWYNICLSHAESPYQDPEGYEAKTLALISVGFIFSGERYYNHQRVSYHTLVLVSVEKYLDYVQETEVNRLCHSFFRLEKYWWKLRPDML